MQSIHIIKDYAMYAEITVISRASYLSRCTNAMEEQEADKNFRSSYYKSLGFKDEEKSAAQLDVLLKAEIFDVKKLKSFCLKHTLTVFYRPLVWKIILSVVPVFSDKDTCSFIKDQKKTEFYDLKQASGVMGRLDHSEGAISSKEFSTSSKLTSSSSCQFSPKHSLLSITDPSASPSLYSPKGTSIDSDSSYSSQVASRSVAEPTSSNQTFYEHRTLSQTPKCTPHDFVIIFLLENNCLLSASVNQMKQEEQVNLLAIAEAFLMVFDEESEDSIYWLFSNFVKKLESQLNMKEELLFAFIEVLEEIDCALLEHIKDLGAVEIVIPVQRWFYQCYARVLPESCIESIWDRVIGGSSMVLVYVGVAILVSLRRKILGFSSAKQLKYILENIPNDNFGVIVNRAIELWEAHGSPLIPSNTLKLQDSPSHQLHYGLNDEIEDYS